MFSISVYINREIENIKNNKSELKYAITNMKNTPEGTNSRLEDAEDQISIMEDRVMELTQLGWQKEIKNIFKGCMYKGALGQHKCTDIHNIGVP